MTDKPDIWEIYYGDIDLACTLISPKPDEQDGDYHLNSYLMAVNCTCLSVSGPPNVNQKTIEVSMSKELLSYLNGDSGKPLWMDDMERIDDETLLGSDGSIVESCGVLYADGSRRMDDEAIGYRKLFMNNVLNGEDEDEN